MSAYFVLFFSTTGTFLCAHDQAPSSAYSTFFTHNGDIKASSLSFTSPFTSSSPLIQASSIHVTTKILRASLSFVLFTFLPPSALTMATLLRHDVSCARFPVGWASFPGPPQAEIGGALQWGVVSRWDCRKSWRIWIERLGMCMCLRVVCRCLAA